MTHVIELEIATPERIETMKMLYGNAFILRPPNGPDLLLDSSRIVIEWNDPTGLAPTYGRSPLDSLRAKLKGFPVTGAADDRR